MTRHLSPPSRRGFLYKNRQPSYTYSMEQKPIQEPNDDSVLPTEARLDSTQPSEEANNASRESLRRSIDTLFPTLYSNLEVKHAQDVLDFEEFVQLRDIGFERFRQDYPPLSEPFDPEGNLALIASLPKEEKVKEFSNYKDAYIRQQAGISECMAELTREFEFLHTLDQDYMVDLVSTYSYAYQFTDEQNRLIWHGIYNYLTSQKSVNMAMDQIRNSDNKTYIFDLLNELVGDTIPTQAILSVRIEPAYIEILVKEAYFDEHYPTRLGMQGIGTTTIDGEQINVYYSIIKDRSTDDNGQSLKATRHHERQHIINDIIQDARLYSYSHFFDRHTNRQAILQQFQSDEDWVSKLQLVSGMCEIEANLLLEFRKNEILASFIGDQAFHDADSRQDRLQYLYGHLQEHYRSDRDEYEKEVESLGDERFARIYRLHFFSLYDIKLIDALRALTKLWDFFESRQDFAISRPRYALFASNLLSLHMIKDWPKIIDRFTDYHPGNNEE